MSTESKTRVVKKYCNRKLYCVENARYVTLNELAAYLKDGGTIIVKDNKSGADLTNSVLKRILITKKIDNQTLLSLIKM